MEVDRRRAAAAHAKEVRLEAADREAARLARAKAAKLIRSKDAKDAAARIAAEKRRVAQAKA